VKKRKDNRLVLVIATLLTFAAIGLLIDWHGSRETVAVNMQYDASVELSFDERIYTMLTTGGANPQPPLPGAGTDDVQASFLNATALLSARNFEQAVDAFHKVLMLQPEMPEAHVNMGFSLIGLQRFETARQFFQSAIDIRPAQRNAYYGLAVAHEELGALHEAIDAMRIYVHLVPQNDPFRRKAESALWEWKAEVDERAP